MPPRIETNIAGVKLTVPVTRDEHTASAVVDAVNERISQIEAESSRINTQHFALLAAYSFAAELEDLRRQAKQQEREFLSKLDELLTKLQTLLDTESTDE